MLDGLDHVLVVIGTRAGNFVLASCDVAADSVREVSDFSMVQAVGR